MHAHTSRANVLRSSPARVQTGCALLPPLLHRLGKGGALLLQPRLRPCLREAGNRGPRGAGGGEDAPLPRGARGARGGEAPGRLSVHRGPRAEDAHDCGPAPGAGALSPPRAAAGLPRLGAARLRGQVGDAAATDAPPADAGGPAARHLAHARARPWMCASRKKARTHGWRCATAASASRPSSRPASSVGSSRRCPPGTTEASGWASGLHTKSWSCTGARNAAGQVISCWSPERDNPNSVVARYFDTGCTQACSCTEDLGKQSARPRRGPVLARAPGRPPPSRRFKRGRRWAHGSAPGGRASSGPCQLQRTRVVSRRAPGNEPSPLPLLINLPSGGFLA